MVFGKAEALEQAAHKFAEAMYAKASQQQGAAGNHDGGGGAGSDAGGAKPGRDDAVDADFEEVKE